MKGKETEYSFRAKNKLVKKMFCFVLFLTGGRRREMSPDFPLANFSGTSVALTAFSFSIQDERTHQNKLCTKDQQFG